MYTAPNGIIRVPSNSQDDNYYFAGWSYGFETKYQKLDPSTYPTIKDA